jgi:hypothetical protein
VRGTRATEIHVGLKTQVCLTYDNNTNSGLSHELFSDKHTHTELALIAQFYLFIYLMAFHPLRALAHGTSTKYKFILN